jgi:hypothetical protein
MSVHHAGDAVESEAVEHERVHVVTEVGQEEAEDLVAAIVEEARVPKLMPASSPLVKVEVVGAVKHVDSGFSVAGCFTYPSRMFLQACEWTTSRRTVRPSSCALSMRDLRSSGVPIISGDGKVLTVTGRGSEEVGHLVTES